MLPIRLQGYFRQILESFSRNTGVDGRNYAVNVDEI